MRNRTEEQIEIRLTLIRHGATLSNKEGRYLGKTDEALSPDGIRMYGRGIPFIELRPPVAFADEHLLAYGAGGGGQPVVCFDSYGHERQIGRASCRERV